MIEEGWDDDACDEILPNLFMSGCDPPKDLDRLKQLGITHIVNLSSYDNCHEDQFTYLRIIVDDFYDSKIYPHLAKAVGFVDNARKEGKVLVHCNYGMSRAGTVIVAYLVTTQNMAVDKALEFARKQRANNGIEPNEGFMKQLYEYEKAIKGSKKK